MVPCVPECEIADGVVFSCLELFPACVLFFGQWMVQQEKVAEDYDATLTPRFTGVSVVSWIPL